MALADPGGLWLDAAPPEVLAGRGNHALLLGHARRDLGGSGHAVGIQKDFGPAAAIWRAGTAVEPRNLVRSFHRICETHGIRAIKAHHLRRTTATLLNNLGVPARDAQLILGHSRLAVTQEIYTHEDREAQQDALTKISRVSLR